MRPSWQRPRSALRGYERTRLMTMIVMLAVIAMLIGRARDPRTWHWLAPDDSIDVRPGAATASAAPDLAGKTAAASAEGAKLAVAAEEALARARAKVKVRAPQKAPPAALAEAAAKSGKSGAVESPPAPASRKAPSKSDAPAPAPAAVEKPSAAPPAADTFEAPDSTDQTDLDPEEVEQAEYEFQAVNDKSLFMKPSEMVPYYHLLNWVLHQKEPAMGQRARTNVVFNDFVQSPDALRGKLIAMDLNVRRILPCEKTREYDGPLYEVWGFSEESKTWLYVAIVPELPAGMPTGPDVYERVRVVGYFFKLQGYQPANAKPNAAPLYAPMLIGRVISLKAPAPKMESNDWYLFGLVAAGIVLIAAVALGPLLLRRGRRSAVQVSAGSQLGTPTADAWLEGIETDDVPPDGTDARV